MIEELRDCAKIKSEAVKRQMEMKHQSKVLPRQFKEFDLVIRRSQMNTMDNKFAPKWSGPYRIKEVIGNKAYQLLDGGIIPQTWNVASLKFYFS